MRATIKDVAREAGVSVGTVSYVLNKRKGDIYKDSHKRVYAAVEKLGYVPDATARNLVNSRTNSIGVIFVDGLGSEEQNPYVVDVISIFTEVLSKQGNWLSLYMTGKERNDEDVEQVLIRASVDGIVWIGSEIPKALIDILDRRSLPHVGIYNHRASSDPSKIVINNETGINEAIKYLSDYGHTKIMCVSGLNDDQHTTRTTFYKNAIDSLELSYKKILNGAYNEEIAYREMIKFLESGEELPTAIFAESDYMAFGIMRALKENNFRIPEDMSVIGFDDILASRRTEPPLTTIRQQLKEVVMIACEYLFECRDQKIRGEGLDKEVETKLIMRKSVAAPREGLN